MGYLITCPYCGNEQKYTPRGKKKIPFTSHTDCKKCHEDFSFEISTTNNSEVSNNKKSNQKPLQEQSSQQSSKPTFIDDPNELLLETAIREVNKPNPDVRWGTILLNLLDKSKQLEVRTQSDVMEKYKRTDITTRIALLKKLEGRS